MPDKIDPCRAREYYERTKMNRDIVEDKIERIGIEVH